MPKKQVEQNQKFSISSLSPEGQYGKGVLDDKRRAKANITGTNGKIPQTRHPESLG